MEGYVTEFVQGVGEQENEEEGGSLGQKAGSRGLKSLSNFLDMGQCIIQVQILLWQRCVSV